jgi:hypothetical protein
MASIIKFFISLVFKSNIMAVDVDNFLIEALKMIKRHKLVFVSELVSFMGVSNFWYYTTHKLNENVEIMQALNKNKATNKRSMRTKWLASDNPVLQVSLYKLLSTDEELQKLSMQHIEQKVDQTIVISFVD